MTWGEIQIESLKKMFLNNDDLSIDELESYKTNKKYKTYLFAMSQAFNEAIRYISNLEPIIKSYELEVDQERYNLKELISDYKCLENVISNKKWGTVIIYYESNPILVDSTTSSETTFDINKDCLQYVPLYIAGELYKDDDLTLSTVYMNEFMNNINLITGRTKNVINNKIIPIYTID